MSNIFEELANSLIGVDPEISQEPIFEKQASLDYNREDRKGVPEIIYAERKRDSDTITIARNFLVKGKGRAIISRAKPELRARLVQELATIEFDGKTIPVSVEEFDASGMLVLKRSDFSQPVTGGQVGIITAGNSDIPVAEEAGVVAREMGCNVTSIYDVGVAGLHRLFRPLQSMLRIDVDVIIVAAGMDGALPSVVAGLVNVPIIGLPVSVGYGLGGKGIAALLTMLQTCAPGLTVVNIDNGVGAGATAALIANRMAAIRNQNSLGL
ncbi:nickel pincer cofactor biosynthesis protein LarB [Candidatus Chlorohelix sp.]|uniref:nickel pincer cofactor biosynthesis protein LarB n=1 Tax=Candidatus Chlorohelix sp. TaxID=3139201 RepID=UPI003048222F